VNVLEAAKQSTPAAPVMFLACSGLRAGHITAARFIKRATMASGDAAVERRAPRRHAAPPHRSGVEIT
jgi:hypothetical protein